MILGKNILSHSRILDSFVQNKTKSMVAFGLIAIMIFMWIRVIAKKGPKSASAMVTTTQSGKPQSSQPPITYVELPFVEGRHDVLERNLFTSTNWKRFNPTDAGDTPTVNMNTHGDRDIAKRLGRLIKLEAIDMNQQRQAFINNKLVPIGGQFVVKDGQDEFECEVVEIDTNYVKLRCEQTEIELRITQKNVVED